MYSKIKKTHSSIIKNDFFVKTMKQLGFREYDLPLNQSEDTRFLVLLVGLMSLLLVLALSGTFALNNMAKRWSSGLENKVTIEIPVETKAGNLLS